MVRLTDEERNRRIEIIREFVKDLKTVKARRIERETGIPATYAGRILRRLGWVYLGSNKTTGKTWTRQQEESE